MRAHPAGPLHGDFLPEHLITAIPQDVNHLAPAVWPSNASRREDGVMTIAGVGVDALRAEYGTPLYVMDESDFLSRARAWRDAFAGGDVSYAGKAFLCREVARWVAAEGLGLDVCSLGELHVALAAQFPTERITFHGNNKNLDELRRALDVGAGRIVADSFLELNRLAEAASHAGIRPRVLIRVTVGVEAHTHEFIATAHEDQKFGFSLSSGAALEAARYVIEAENLEFVGLHSHIGSQIFDTSGFEVSARRLAALAGEIRSMFGVEPAELNLGGGLGIAYKATDDPSTPYEIADSLVAIVKRECAEQGLDMPRVAVEPGRAIVGPSGITLYEIGTIKPVTVGPDATRTYVSVDGGMSDNIRTALYDADYTCVLANRVSDAAPMLARVVGKHCEAGDVVVREAYLPSDAAPGDLLAVAATGAYCRSMASNYNYIPRPPVVTVREGEARVIVRGETIEELVERA